MSVGNLGLLIHLINYVHCERRISRKKESNNVTPHKEGVVCNKPSWLES